MKAHENKEVFGHNFGCQSAWASLGERQARVQEVPGPSARPGGVGPRGQKPLRDKYFHEAFTWRPHEPWPGSRSGKVRCNQPSAFLTASETPALPRPAARKAGVSGSSTC